MREADRVTTTLNRDEGFMVNDGARTSRTDEELWHAFQAGEDAAYTQLYRRYGDRVYAYLRLLLSTSERTQLDDLFQETWIRVYEQRKKFEVLPGASLAGWIFRLAHNFAISALRKSKHMPSFDDEELSLELEHAVTLPLEEAFSDELSTEQLMVHVLRLIDELPLMLREVFVLSEIDRLSLEAVSETLGISKTNAKVRLFRARKLMRTMLEPIKRSGQ